MAYQRQLKIAVSAKPLLGSTMKCAGLRIIGEMKRKYDAV